MELEGDGTTVTLNGSPVDGTYVKSYPVANVQRMAVTVTPAGDILALCTNSAGTAACAEHPFFSQVQRKYGRSYIKVFDVFGAKVATAVACEPDGDAGNCDVDAGDNGGDPPEYPPGTNSDGGAGGPNCNADGGPGMNGDGSTGTSGDGGTGSSDEGGTTTANDGGAGTGDDGGNGSGTPGCDATAVAAEQQKFCSEVDQWLQQHGINYTVDCSQLNGHFDYKHSFPPADHVDIPCLEIVEQAWIDVSADLQACNADVQSTVINWKSSSRWDLIQHGECRGSPLVLDLDGDGVNLSSLDQGVAFDLFGNGQKVKTAWIGQGDGWLVLDRNGNGIVDGAAELFGNATASTAHNDGFQALSELDANGDGRVDARDAEFENLRVWKDANRDGKSSPSELISLADLKIRAINVTAARNEGVKSWDPHGNQIPLVGEFVRSDGTLGMVADAYLRFQPLK